MSSELNMIDNKIERKPVKVNCSFCGSEIECPEDMLDSSKHMCYRCFIKHEPGEEELKNVHVDIPTDKMAEVSASGMADALILEAFPDIWAEKKKELKEMSRRDVAAEMFGAGVYLGVMHFMEAMKVMKKDDDED